MSLIKQAQVMVVTPHPDDAEIGMGGTIALMLAEGLRVGVLELTNGEPTPQGSKELRQSETEAATQVLGIPWRKCLGLPNRSLEHTLDSRWLLAKSIREARPQFLFAPYWEDSHPDHLAATAMTEAARFWAKLTKSDIPGQPHWARHLYYYFSVHLKVPEHPSFIIDISAHIDTKLRALRCYQSQFGTKSAGSASDVIEDLRARARYWGWTIGASYGEPFASREPLGLSRMPCSP